MGGGRGGQKLCGGAWPGLRENKNRHKKHHYEPEGGDRKNNKGGSITLGVAEGRSPKSPPPPFVWTKVGGPRCGEKVCYLYERHGRVVLRQGTVKRILLQQKNASSRAVWAIYKRRCTNQRKRAVRDRAGGKGILTGLR